MTGRSGGPKKVPTRINDQTTASAGGSSAGAATSPATNAIGDSVRRRLSSIFQRPRRLMPERRRTIHGNSCQSPRAHRWVRAADTSYDMGNCSTTSTSVTRPERA